MFNISFSEIFIISVVGLIVIGPKRLPETARFIGHLVGRVQRQVAGVKADIRREMQLEDLKNIHRQYEDAAKDAKSAFEEDIGGLRREAESAISPPVWPGDGGENNGGGGNGGDGKN